MCLKMILKHYGITVPIDHLRELCETTRQGTTLKSMVEGSEKLGFRVLPVRINIKDLKEIHLPCIALSYDNHFIVIHKITTSHVYVADPAYGLLDYSYKNFMSLWQNTNTPSSESKGIIILLEPSNLDSSNFTSKSEQIDSEFNLRLVFKKLKFYKKYLIQVILGLVVTTTLTLLYPLLNQGIIDIGINNSDLKFICIIIFVQLIFFLVITVTEVIRSWLILYITNRLSITLLSDFFNYLIKLSIKFFDARVSGDIIQRFQDLDRVKNLLKSHSLSALVSLVNVLLFSIILGFYNLRLLFILLFFNTLYAFWNFFFLKRRRTIDYQSFYQSSQEHIQLMEFLNGIKDIKMHNAESYLRYKWEVLQEQIFHLSNKMLNLEQIQFTGASVINELKNLAIVILTAKLVIINELTLGGMLSILFIVGSLNRPIEQLISFIFNLQDAKIALERMFELYNPSTDKNEIRKAYKSTHIIPGTLSGDLTIDNLTFRYLGTSTASLRNLNCSLIQGKTTAIVGFSGSGKTTLMKVILKFYEPTQGNIYVGKYNLAKVDEKLWREKCGVVMQDGFIFNDTITTNIALGHEAKDMKKVIDSARLACIDSFIEELPLGYETKVGQNGLGLSTGQRQRILIARAIYKNPDYIFLDEATNSLDAKNESLIMQNILHYMKGKTMVIIAHRLSTVVNVDNIIVLDNGEIIETGNHKTLMNLKGTYHQLIQAQLNL